MQPWEALIPNSSEAVLLDGLRSGQLDTAAKNLALRDLFVLAVEGLLNVDLTRRGPLDDADLRALSRVAAFAKAHVHLALPERLDHYRDAWRLVGAAAHGLAARSGMFGDERAKTWTPDARIDHRALLEAALKETE